MRTAELKKKILLMFRGRELYGYEINKMLSFQDTSINISRLYNVLNQMQTEGLLHEHWENSTTGPKKKMYKLSTKGKAVLNEILLEAISTVHLFYGDYLRDLYPQVDVFEHIFKLITDGLESDDTAAYLSYSFTGIHEMIITRIYEKLSNGKLYLVTPEPSESHIDLENLNVLDGTYDNLPFKSDYLDRFVIVGIPKQSYLQETIREWGRVIAKGGRLIVITPTILIQKQDDPISIGDFVEKYEHLVIEKGEPIDPELFFSNLEETFNKVEELRTVHMSFITAYN